MCVCVCDKDLRVVIVSCALWAKSAIYRCLVVVVDGVCRETGEAECRSGVRHESTVVQSTRCCHAEGQHRHLGQYDHRHIYVSTDFIVPHGLHADFALEVAMYPKRSPKPQNSAK